MNQLWSRQDSNRFLLPLEGSRWTRYVLWFNKGGGDNSGRGEGAQCQRCNEKNPCIRTVWRSPDLYVNSYSHYAARKCVIFGRAIHETRRCLPSAVSFSQQRCERKLLSQWRRLAYPWRWRWVIFYNSLMALKNFVSQESTSWIYNTIFALSFA